MVRVMFRARVKVRIRVRVIGLGFHYFGVTWMSADPISILISALYLEYFDQISRLSDWSTMYTPRK